MRELFLKRSVSNASPINKNLRLSNVFKNISTKMLKKRKKYAIIFILIKRERRADMLFTSPIFMFLLLPISMCIYALVGKKRRRICLTVIFIVFHILLNLRTPLNMLYLPCLIAYSYLAAKLLRIKKSAFFCVCLCVAPYIALFFVRGIAYFGEGNFIYPVGFTVATLFSTSYIITQYRQKRGDLGSIFDLARYILFFPVMIVGPIIRYEDFLRISDEENICFDRTNVASGVRLFCIGVIKRVAVGAVLYEMYDVFFGLFYDTPNPLVTVFILVTVYFATFFTVAGYIDIGVGLARMYGLSFETYVVADPFRASTFTVYFGNLFTGLSLWIDDYLINPIISRSGENKKRLSGLIRAVCYGAVSILFIRSTPSMIALCVPVVIFFYMAFRFRLDERLASRTGLRTLMTLVTMLAVAIVWVFIILGDPKLVVGYLEDMTGEGSEYKVDQILSTFSSMKYLFVMIIAGLTMWVSRIEAYMRAPELSKQKVYSAAQYISFLLILVIFSFTVVFFMPQFEIYDLVPFSHLFI